MEKERYFPCDHSHCFQSVFGSFLGRFGSVVGLCLLYIRIIFGSFSAFPYYSIQTARPCRGNHSSNRTHFRCFRDVLIPLSFHFCFRLYFVVSLCSMFVRCVTFVFISFRILLFHCRFRFLASPSSSMIPSTRMKTSPFLGSI